MKDSYTLLCLLLMAACLVVPSVARGGRGRGGGSFGGLFGGWRSKYGSKSASTGGGRRVVSGSPVHTALTVPKVPPPPPPLPAGKTMSMPKSQNSNYPRQQLPPGYSYNNNAAGAAPQGTYYANAHNLPAGATYYAQPPTSMFMGPGTSGFLTGMLAGRMLFGHHHHHTSNVYRQNQQVDEAAGGATGGNGRDIIIINNGQPPVEEEVEGNGQQQTPQSLDGNEAFSENPLTEGEEEPDSVSSEETSDSNEPAAPPVGGIVCFPIMLNETDPENAELQREVERVVCFPVPTPDPQLASVDCQNNPECLYEMSTTSTVPPVVAGDIGGAVQVDSSLEASSPVTDLDVDVDVNATQE